MASTRVLGLEREGLRATAAVMALLAFIGLGLPLIDAAIPGDEAIAAGTVLDTGTGVSFVPPAGWSRDRGATDLAAGIVVLHDGPVTITVVGGPATGSAAARFAALRADLIGRGGLQVAPERETFATASGDAGIVGVIDGDGGSGLLATAVGGGVAADVVVLGPSGSLDEVADDASELLGSLRLGAGR